MSDALYLTTDEVLERFRGRICRESLMRLALDGPTTDRPSPLRCYAGTPGKRSARYLWSAAQLDAWFEEVCGWPAFTNRTAAGGKSAGKSEVGLEARPSGTSGKRSGSRSRSRTPSTVSADTNLVELAGRLRSE